MADNKQEIIRSIGAALAERRKARGLSIEKISQVLKIRVPYLKAMEAGDWGELPGEVYARGFVKRYAVYLGLDADKLMAPYATDRTTADATQSGDMGGGAVSPSSGSDSSKGILVAVSVAAVFLIVLVKLAKNDKAKPAAEAPATVAVAPSTGTAVAVPATTESATASAPAPATGLTTPADSHKLEIFSPYPLWVRVTAEDKNFEGFIPQGATWTWSAKGRFQVRFGHSRKVNVLFDGVAVPLEENQKKVDLPE